MTKSIIPEANIIKAKAKLVDPNVIKIKLSKAELKMIKKACLLTNETVDEFFARVINDLYNKLKSQEDVISC